jgi:TIR domain
MSFLIEVFLCYAHEDEALRKELATHLGALKRQHLIDIWHDREISAGTEWAQEIDKHLNTAQIILLLVSQYFMNSDYCYLVEMERAIERHERGEARVIPVILRPVYYKKAPFAKLQPLPTNGKPIMGPGWYNLDEAFFDVAEGIRKAVEELPPIP